MIFGYFVQVLKSIRYDTLQIHVSFNVLKWIILIFAGYLRVCETKNSCK
jgi:hypothetical protein